MHRSRFNAVHRMTVLGVMVASVLLAAGCYRKVIRAEGIGARTANPRLERSSVPEKDPVGDFLFGPRDSNRR